MEHSPISASIAGKGYSLRRVGDAFDAVQFNITPVKWNGSSEALCHVRLVDNEEVIFDGEIRGIDPLQALELSIKFVRQFTSMFRPDEQYAELTRNNGAP